MFDLTGAKKAGYTDEEIATHLAEKKGFDLQSAIGEGYSHEEVIDHLIGRKPSGIYAAPERTLKEKVSSWMHTPNVSKDKAAILMNESQLTGESPSKILEREHKEKISNLLNAATIVSLPAIGGAMGAGKALSVAKGLGAYTGITELVNAIASKKGEYQPFAGKRFSENLELEGTPRTISDIVEEAVKLGTAGSVAGLAGRAVEGVKGVFKFPPSKINIKTVPEAQSRVGKILSEMETKTAEQTAKVGEESMVPPQTVPKAQPVVEKPILSTGKTEDELADEALKNILAEKPREAGVAGEQVDVGAPYAKPLEERKFGEIQGAERLDPIVEAWKRPHKTTPNFKNQETLDIVEKTKTIPDEGGTFNLDGSVYKGGGFGVSAKSINIEPSELTPEFLEAFANKVKKDIPRKMPDAHFKWGIWYDPATKKINVALTSIHPTEEAAIRQGIRNDQKFGFNYNEYKSFEIGGSDTMAGHDLSLRDLSDMYSGKAQIFEGKLSRFGKGTTERKLMAPVLAELQGEGGFVDVGRGDVAYNLGEIVQPKDVLPMVDLIISPETLAKGNPDAEAVVSGMTEGYQKTAFEHQDHLVFMDEVKYGLEKVQAEAVGKVAEGKATSTDPKVVKAAGQVRKYFDMMKEQYKNYKRVMYRKYLDNQYNEGIDRVLDGKENIKEVAQDLSIDHDVLHDYIREYQNIDNWGIDNFVTHIERGTYRFVDKEGVTVLIGVTKKHAIEKALDYLKRNPDVKKLWLDTSFASTTEFPTKLSRGQYYNLARRLASGYEEDVRTIQETLHKNGSIVAIEPTQKYAGAAMHRYGILEGEKNIFDVLPAYDYMMVKKMNLDPVLADARNILWKLPPNLRKAMTSYVEDVKGRKTIGDHFVDALATKVGFGWKPFALSRAVSKIRTGVTWGKLGYRPIAGMINLAGGQSHTLVKTGLKYYSKAVKLSFTSEGKALLDKEAPYMGTSFAQEATGRVSDVPLWHPMGVFQKAEIPNRHISYLANYLMGIEKYGFSEAAARQFARRSVRFQQFTYDVASLPKLMRSPMGKLVLQFKPYLIKEIEFITSLRGAEILKYIGSFLALGGVRGFVFLLKSLPVLSSLGLLDKADTWISENYPRASRGVAGLVGRGYDVTAPATFQFPKTESDWMGAFFGDLYKFKTDVVDPYLQGETHLTEIAKKDAMGVIPALQNWDKIIDSVIDPEGWIHNERGQRMYKLDKWDRVALGIGAKPLKVSMEEVALREIAREELIEKNSKARIIDEINTLRKANKEVPDELINEAIESGAIRRKETGEGWDFSSLNKDLTESFLTPRQRLMLRVSKKNRPKLIPKE
jgi:hypothetical protein